MSRNSSFKKWTSYLVALTMVLYIAFPGFTSTAKAAETTKVFDLIGITDFHGQLEPTSKNPGAAALSKAVKDVKSSNPNRTLVIGGGDFYQGSPLSNILFGVPVQKVMSDLGMEVTALGNHEFDWGLDKINTETMKDASFEILCANMFNKGTNNRPYKPYKIIEKDGVKIGVIGAMSLETPTIVLNTRIDKYDVRDEATEINKVAEEIKDKTDVIIATVHEGERDDLNNTPLTNISKKLKNVDAVFGGHSHWKKDSVVKNADGKDMPVVIAWAEGKGFIDLKMTVGPNKEISFSNDGKNYHSVAIGSAKDAKAEKIVKAATDQVGPLFKEKIGVAEQNLTRSQKGKYSESQLGVWTSEAIRKAGGNADVGIQNNGGIRCDIDKGDITVGTIYSLMPFDNELVTLQLTGSQLKKLFEQSIVDNGKGIQISGVKFEYDLSKTNMNRVTKVTREDGKEIGNDEKLKVATSDFLSTGTVEGYTVLAEKNVQASKKTDHTLLRDVFMNEVKNTGKMEVKMIDRIKAVSGTETPKLENIDFQILATSDMHNRMVGWDYATDSENTKGSIAKVATKVKELRNENTLLVDGGDVVQDNSASLFLDSTKYPVHPMIQGMNKLGYDTWTLGNHEFNYGMDKLKGFINTSKAAVLCANLYDTDGKTRITAPYKIVEKNGVKIGVIGVTTPNITKWDSVNLKDYKVTGAVEEVNAAIKELQGKVDFTIGVFHMGEQNEYDTEETGVIDVASKCPGLSLVVAAHMHVTIAPHYVYNGLAYAKDSKGVITKIDNNLASAPATEEEYNTAKEKGTMIVEAGKFAENLAKINLNLKLVDGKYQVTDKKVNLENLSNVKEDQEFVELFKHYDEIAKKDAQVVIGELKGGDLVPADEVKGIPESQIRPTAMIDLINKVQMHYGEKLIGEKIDVAAAAAFRGDANIKEGKITKSGTSLIYKFDNTLYVLEITGKQLKQYMEWTASYYNKYKDGDLTISFNPKMPGYNYDMFTGVKYDVDISKDAGSRIANLTKMDGTPITDDMKLNLAVNDYRAKSQLTAAKGILDEPAKLLVKSEDKWGDEGRIRDLISKYIVEEKGGVITPDCDNNWKVTGNNWSKAARNVAVDLVNSGKLSVKGSEDGKTSNAEPITVEDVKNAGASIPEDVVPMETLTPAKTVDAEEKTVPTTDSTSTDDSNKESQSQSGDAKNISKDGTSNKSNSHKGQRLVKTGSPVDTRLVSILGFMFIVSGAYICTKKKSKAQ